MDTISERKVGMFVFIGTLLLILVIFSLGGNRSILSSTYELRLQMKQVQGIGKGSVVQLIGLPVGNVSRIDFGKNNEDLIVIMEIDKSYQDRITEGSTAGLRTAGALGDKYIFITPGPSDAPPLSNKAFLETEVSGDIFSKLNEGSKSLGQIFEIISEFQLLLKDIRGDGEIKEILQNLSEISSNLKVLTENMKPNQSGKSIQESLTKLEKVLTRIEAGEGSLGAIIKDPSLYNRLKELVGAKKDNPVKDALRESIKSE